MKITYTHKGWFGLCPVKIADPDSNCPALDPRFKGTEWLFDLSEVIFDFMFVLLAAVSPAYEPEWPIRITGTLPTPITRVIED